MAFYEVIFPSLGSPVKNIFTYESQNLLSPGDLVEAELKNNSYKGIILNATKKPLFKTKKINSVISAKFLEERQLKLYDYINSYYFANPVKTIKLFLPKKIFTSRKPFNLDAIKDKKVKIKSQLKNLNEKQTDIFKEIKKNPSKIHLIHGITGSGKTEIYLQLANEEIVKGNQVLIMVPEIALTPQISSYFTNHFGTKIVTVFHSKLNNTEQLNEWIKIKNETTRIVVGSRSSLFLPFAKLSLIVMDEEQDFAYKQDQNPRYHARNLIQFINAEFGTTVVLGSATPSVETYYASKIKNKAIYHHLSYRTNNLSLPKIEVIDMKDEYKKGNYTEISEHFATEIQKTLTANEQVLILHNKRGYAHYLQCTECGTVIKCPRCSISLTLHKNNFKEILRCHYCDYQTTNLASCPKCKNIALKEVGAGIQKIIQNLEDIFPQTKIIRVDSDTTTKKHAHNEIIEDIANLKADIIVGTQMISIGMDMPQIQLVGVANADIGLSMPDFRAQERAFQLLTQVAGRAGRSKDGGKVIIQTLDTEHPVIQSVVHNHVEQFYEKEIEERKRFKYPPFAKLTKLTFSHKDIGKVENEVSRVEKILTSLKAEFKSAPALIEKKYNKFYHNILIDTLNPEKYIEHLKLGLGWWIDRDPISTI